MDFDYSTETISPDSTNILSIGGTGALGVPVGTTAQRPGTAVAGNIRWNTSTPALEVFNSSTWVALGAGGGSGTPGGATTQLQFNNAGAFAGSANLTVNLPTGTLIAASGITLSGTTSPLILNSSAGTSGQVLTSVGAGATPIWATAGGSSASITLTIDTFTGNGVQTVFVLSVSPASVKYISVNYNGIILLQSNYSLTGSSVTFSSAPANGSYIEITSTTSGTGSSINTNDLISPFLMMGA